MQRVILPGPGSNDWSNLNQDLLHALDINLISFIRFMQTSDAPSWSLVGPKLFAATEESAPLVGAFVAKTGYYTTLKTCLAGLVLNVDLSVNVFVDAGPLIDIMRRAVELRSVDDLHNDLSRQSISSDRLERIRKAVKSIKIRTTHTGFSKKVIDLGPAADSPESAFEHDGRRITVAQYFELMCRDRTKPLYRQALPTGRLRYPKLPTVNIGSNSHPVLVPSELCHVTTPQNRKNVITPEMTAQIIRIAAKRPDDRMRQITSGSTVVTMLRDDPNNRAMGLHQINPEPMAVSATILPPAQIVYKDLSKVDPGLRGEWKMDGKRFYASPPGADTKGRHKYGVLLVGNGPPPGDWRATLGRFQEMLEQDGARVGLNLAAGGPPLPCPPVATRIQQELTKLKDAQVHIAICVMVADRTYGLIKKEANGMGLMTQCILWKTIERSPAGLSTNVLIKMNAKMGGTNHVLASRAATTGGSQAKQFQEPRSSISWVMDKPCMFLGIDVSHPEAGSDKPSVAAVVASMDGKLSQYCAYVTSQTSNKEMVTKLEDAIHKLLETFRSRNRVFPESIVVYRDGVSEGQFDQVLRDELPQIHGALERCGYVPNDQVKVSVVVCQKRHHTRVVYEDRTTNTMINPCPGLVVDARGGDRSIVSGSYNEFYLNTHVAIQGTAKPCKYTLIYDEIGFKLSELELLTNWTTYLYSRCNRSVSYATPAYYAHWASQHAKEMVAAGAIGEELENISKTWARGEGNKPTMFFL